MTEGGGRRKQRAGKATPRLTEKELEEERQRKADRNRAVFMAWLERKQEEEKVRQLRKTNASHVEYSISRIDFHPLKMLFCTVVTVLCRDAVLTTQEIVSCRVLAQRQAIETNALWFH